MENLDLWQKGCVGTSFLLLLVDVDWNWNLHDDFFFNIDWNFLDDRPNFFDLILIERGYDFLVSFKFNLKLLKFTRLIINLSLVNLILVIFQM